MANIDKTGTGPTNGVIPHKDIQRTFVIANTIDLTGGAIVQGDVYQCLSIPADTLVESVHIRIDTAAAGTTLTMNVGDGGATNGWMASVDGKATAGTFDHSTGSTDARAVEANNGYFYDTADSIDVVMTTATAITAGPKMTVFAVCSYLG